ncbi:MAG: flagellar hook-basal body complex protein FliE [Spirochaetaceae bacterium]|nr:flagellar hook-basal body complex protein FliE [Spirochaetaceae bacterium]
MTLYRPELVTGDRVPMRVTHPHHMVPQKGNFIAEGKALSELGNKIGVEGVLRSGTFEDAMLKALDMVSTQQQAPGDLIQAALTDPGTVDVHDITIAQAKASMSLNITRTVLNRIVQGWKDLINTR